MNFRRTLALLTMACFLVVPAVPARAGGQLPDIRGLSFVYPFQGVEFFAGTVPGFGFLTDPLADPTSPQTFIPTIPSTFDVTADPAAPNDPSRIQIDTRLFTTIDPLVDVPLTLTGTYNQTTGAISVSGGSSGTFLNNRGPDPFGLFPGTNLFEQLTDPMESLHGVVSVSGGQITITGTDPVVTPGDPGNISFASANLLWIPTGSTNPNDAVYSVGVQNPTGAIYNWSATSVPEPGSMVLVLSGLAASFVGWKLRQGRTV
jgi:hypothetical protein